MMRVWGQATVAWAAIALLGAACGGQTELAATSSLDAGSPDAVADAGSSDAAPDAGRDAASADAAACVTIDVATYDTSCHVDSDCIDVTAGTICTGYTCICGGAAVSADEQARYQAALASVAPGPGPLCQCPWLGNARCIQSQCVYCPAPYNDAPRPPGCGDGG